MNNKLLEIIKYLCKCIYYSTDLVSYCFYKNNVFYSTNEKSITAHKVLYGKHRNLNILDKISKYQIITNEYKESFFVISYYDLEVLIIIGPFLSETINEGTVTNMIRNDLIPFHSKTDIHDYYKTLPVFSEDKVFYISKLIENVFNSLDITIPSSVNSDGIYSINKDDEYYLKIKQNRANSFSHSSYANEQKIVETIKNGDTENAKRILNEINLTPHAKLAMDEIRSYKNSMICSCTFMTRAAISGGVNPDSAFTLSDTYINKIENIQNLNELETFEATMVEGFTDLVNSINKTKYSRPILASINYIDSHLCEKIKIEDIAKSVYLNPCYLSDLFHRETNIKISDWIMTKRINEAAFSVINTNENIADIAFFYNFCSQSYFVKCFKKIIGVTPGEYRKNKIKDAN